MRILSLGFALGCTLVTGAALAQPAHGGHGGGTHTGHSTPTHTTPTHTTTTEASEATPTPAAATPAAATPAAPDTEDARALFARGQVAYTQGDYEDAITLWTRAYALDARPLLQWNLAQAYERLVRLGEAVTALEIYLAHADPADEHQADARARIASLEERIAATGVLLRGGPDGAVLLVDGEDAGRLPRRDALRLTPGSHRVIVRAEGYADFSSAVVIPAGQTVELAVEMARADSGVPAAPVALLAIGGASLLTGAVLGGVALGQAGSAPSSDSPAANDARTLALAADVTMGVGIACATVGVVLLLVGNEGEGESHAALEVSPWGGPDGAGASLIGAF